MQNQLMYPNYQMPYTNGVYGGYNQYPQYNCANCTPCQPNYPTSSVGAVNIQIFNPTANSGANQCACGRQGFYSAQPNMMQYPYNYNNMMYPDPSAYNPNMINPNMNGAMNMSQSMNGIAGQAEGDKGTKTEKDEKEKDKKPKVPLTDDYVRTLENYLNSQDKKIRLMGAKELFERFKEDETRKDDAALTALLNKTLQDPAETVKFVALTALDNGYATGNDETAAILTQIQNSNSSYGEDASLASRVLLKMSGYKATADAMAMPENAHLNKKNNMNMAANGTNSITNNNFSMPEPSLQNIQPMNMNQTPDSMKQNMSIAPQGQAINMNQTPQGTAMIQPAA